MEWIWGQFSNVWTSFQAIAMVLGAILNLVFASGVARDISEQNRMGGGVRLIPAYAWVLGTLLMGIWMLAFYWWVHHANKKG